MRYVKVTSVDQLPPGGKQKVTLEGKTLLLTNVDGAVYAVDNRCPHMGGSLFDGKLEGGTVTCPRHHTVFNVKTGNVVQNGSLAFIRLKVADTRAYPTKVEGGDILVGIE
jgi:3-phenylpropionate/trans-cinnamate dioxygenase ferredoxin subunit